MNQRPVVGGGGAYKKSSQKLDEKVCFGDDVNEI